MTGRTSEYIQAHFIGSEILWGEGYMSPGGDEEVASVVEGVEIAGKTILDIGCGSGGATVALAANHDARKIIAIDIQPEQLERARKLSERRGVSDRTFFRLVETGAFAFEDATFDVVFSMASIVQIPDKPALFAEILRVLRPGGTLAANDWLRGVTGPFSKDMATFVKRSGLTYNWSTPDQTRDALVQVGFTDVNVRDRRLWHLEQVRAEIAKLENGSTRERMIESFDDKATDNWLYARRRTALLVDHGEICVVQIRATKPA